MTIDCYKKNNYYTINYQLNNGNIIHKNLQFIESYPDLLSKKIKWFVFRDDNNKIIIFNNYNKNYVLSL